MQVDTGTRDDLADAALDQRNREDVLVECDHGEHTQESVLPHDVSLVVEDRDTHEVRVDSAVHRGGERSLRQDQKRSIREICDGRQTHRAFGDRVGAQHAESTAGYRA